MKRMTMTAVSLIVCFSTVLLYGQERISLQEVMAIDGLETESISQWAGIATDEQGNIYLTDMMESTIKKFNQEGELIKEAGRPGQGPGEFQKPVKVVYLNKRLYVLDLFSRGISVFDDTLNFLHDILNEQILTDIDVVDANQLICNASVGKSGIFLCDTSGTIQSCIFLNKDNSSGIFSKNSGDMTVDSNGNIYLVCSFRDCIIKMKRNGDVVWERNFFKKVRSKEKMLAGQMVPTKIVYKSVALDSRNNVYVLGGSFSEHPGRDVYVISSEGDTICTMTLPESSHMIHIDHRDFLYARSDMGVGLKKYQLVFE